MLESEAVIRRYIDQLNNRNFAILDEVVADLVDMGTDGTVTREEYRKAILLRIDRYPDYHVSVKEATEERDEVILHWAVRGTDIGSGEKLAANHVSAYRLSGGRIVAVRDVAG